MMRRAFSLVELSIVLVILGLLTGGILAGQSLIRAAELRGLHTDGMKYITAVHTFRDKYFALPGDMNNATKFWGAAHATPATCRTTASTDQRTCDGNGNGQITSTGTSYEDMRFWQHLANAGLLEGKYDGVNDYASAKLQGSHWTTYYYGQYTGGTTQFSGFWGHDFELDGDGGVASRLTPAEAWNIDTKSDDGLPGKGKLWAYKGDAGNPCTTMYDQASDTGAVYNLNYNANACWIYYVNVF